LVNSWASGSNPWGPERDDQFQRPNHYDGMLEVVGVTGVVHMGQIQSGLRSAMRIAQGGHVSKSIVQLQTYLREIKEREKHSVLSIYCKLL
jgi:hypothetical protein